MNLIGPFTISKALLISSICSIVIGLVTLAYTPFLSVDSESRATAFPDKITADIFGLPVSRPHLYEASGLGAAIDASVGLGIHKDFTAAVSAMTLLGETFQPDPKAHEIYNELYTKVYLKLYDRLKPLYHDLQQILEKER